MIIKQVGKQIKDQHTQSKAHETSTVANVLPSNSKSGLLYWIKRSTFNKIFERTCIQHYLKISKPEYAILVLNLVANFITSKIQLRNLTSATLSIIYVNWPKPSCLEFHDLIVEIISNSKLNKIVISHWKQEAKYLFCIYFSIILQKTIRC